MKNIFFLCCVWIASFTPIAAQTTFSKAMGANTNDNDAFHAMCLTPEGGYIATGEGGAFGIPNSILIKMDNVANLQWSANFGGSINIDEPDNIRAVSTCGYILAGESYNASTGNSDPYIVRMDNNGTIMWKKTITGSADLWVRDVVETNNGFVFCGAYSSSGTASTLDGVIMKTDTSGNILWTRRTGYSSSTDDFYCLVKTVDNGVVVLGKGIPSSVNIELMKIDSSGTLQWSRIYTAVGGSLNPGVSGALRVTNDGGLVFSGYYNSAIDNGAFLVKTDALGQPQWFKVLNNTNYGNSIVCNIDGGYTVATGGLFGGSYNKSCLTKTDNLGNVMWTKSYNDSTYLYSAQATNDGGFVAAGHIYQFATWRDNWIVKTDSLGNVPGCSNTETVVSDTAGYNFYPVSGFALSPMSLTTSNMTLLNNMVTPIQFPFCSSVTTGISETNEEDFLIYPNPTMDVFKITSNEKIISVKIVNALGEQIIQKSNSIIDISNHPTGFYLIRIETEKGIVTKKIVKQ